MRFKQHVLLKHDHGITAQWVSDDWSWMAVATYFQLEQEGTDVDGNTVTYKKWVLGNCSGPWTGVSEDGKNLTIIHGHELFNSTAPVNFARTLQTNLGVCAIAGHRHQTSQHAFKTADDKHIHCWSLGCLCDMAPDYAVINRWNHGFATLELDKNTFQVQNLRIIEGSIF